MVVPAPHSMSSAGRLWPTRPTPDCIRCVDRFSSRTACSGEHVTETIAVKADRLYKAFGRRPQEIVKKLDAGASRSEVASLGTPAVIDASFEVKKGEIFVVMGLSGSGKSTLIRMLNGLLDATSRNVDVGWRRFTAILAKPLRDVRRSCVSMVFQHFALLPYRTVID